MLTDQARWLCWRHVPPSGQQVLPNILPLSRSHLLQRLARACETLCAPAEKDRSSAADSGEFAPAASGVIFLNAIIVLHEAFLLIRRHVLQLFDPLWRQAHHLAALSGGIPSVGSLSPDIRSDLPDCLSALSSRCPDSRADCGLNLRRRSGGASCSRAPYRIAKAPVASKQAQPAVNTSGCRRIAECSSFQT